MDLSQLGLVLQNRGGMPGCAFLSVVGVAGGGNDRSGGSGR